MIVIRQREFNSKESKEANREGAINQAIREGYRLDLPDSDLVKFGRRSIKWDDAMRELEEEKVKGDKYLRAKSLLTNDDPLRNAKLYKIMAGAKLKSAAKEGGEQAKEYFDRLKETSKYLLSKMKKKEAKVEDDDDYKSFYL